MEGQGIAHEFCGQAGLPTGSRREAAQADSGKELVVRWNLARSIELDSVRRLDGGSKTLPAFREDDRAGIRYFPELCTLNTDLPNIGTA